MTFRQIEYFMTIAECKNFSVAAKKLYVSQPAISQQLSMMEQELGYSLFARSNRRVDLTKAGEIFYDACLQMRKIYNDANARIEKILCQDAGQLTIGMLESMSVPPLSKLLKDFSLSHAADSIQMESHSFSGLIKGLSSGKLDLIITLSLDPGIHHVQQKHLIETPCILVISKNHPLSGKENLTIRDFDNDIFYQIANDDLPSADHFMNSLFSKFGITPQKSICVPNPSSMLLMLGSGAGVGVMDQFSCPEIRKYNNFRSLDIGITHQVTAAWNDENGNPLLADFLQQLDKSF